MPEDTRPGDVDEEAILAAKHGETERHASYDGTKKLGDTDTVLPRLISLHPHMPQINRLSNRPDRHNLISLPSRQAIEIVCPCLHHLPAFRQIFGMVIHRSDLVPVGVGQLFFD